MRHQQQRAVVGVQGLLELLDGGQVKVVGRFVENEHVGAARLQQCQAGARPLAGRQFVDGALHVVCAQAELREQCADVGGRPVRHTLFEPIDQTRPAGEKRTRLVDFTDGHIGTQAGAALIGLLTAQQHAQQRRLARPVRAGDTDALTRVELQRHRPEYEIALAHNGIVEGRHHRTRPRRRADGELQRPLLAGLGDLFEAGDPAFHLAHLLRLLLAGLRLSAAAVLVVVRGFAHRVANTLARPLALDARPSHQIGLLFGELFVLLATVPAVDLAFFQVAVVSAAEYGRGVLCQVEFQHTGYRARQELSIMAHHHDATAEFLHELFETGQAVEVEVVRRLVEQHDVEPRQH